MESVAVSSRGALASLAHLAPYEDRLVETLRAGELETLVVALARRAPRMAQLTLRRAKMVLRTAREAFCSCGNRCR